MVTAGVQDTDLYRGKVVLAPMVHAGRTPLRLLALQYGANLAYTEEIIDKKLLASRRIENDMLGTIDYAIEDEIVLRVASPFEKAKCVVQIGTNEVERAIEVVKKIENDVSGLDINMGCPKPFSITGGMGAALLSKPYLVKQILCGLVSVSKIPISCKVRVLDKREETLEFVKMIEKCGIAGIAVHGRRKDERRSDNNRLDEIREIVRAVSIPVIANGHSSMIKENGDILKFWKDSEASSVMVARRALCSPSIFRPDGLLSTEQETRDFIKLACEYDENFTFTKYVVQRILGSMQESDARGRETVAAASVTEICKAWSLDDLIEQRKMLITRERKRKWHVDYETGVSFIDLTFPPKRLKDRRGALTPKCVLIALCDELNIKRPIYDCKYRNNDKRYEATIEVNGQKFSSRIGQPNKKMAEQVAALAALIGLNKRQRLPGDWED